ncbi:MAG: GGDEF domain-containing protein [Actinomycetota bacterium]|jgi:diguanylate cyclase (GGDEF)-like protein|nr:GGDEF domain-containing protein [Actinomycetota bacterium]
MDRDTASPGEAPGEVPGEASVALGRALADRAVEVARSIAADWEARAGFHGTPEELQLRADTLRVTELGVRAVARFLMTGRSPTTEEASSISATGQAGAARRVALATLAKLYLSWRDHTVEALRHEAAALGTPPDVLELALDLVRTGADASLVSMAKSFDRAYDALQSELAAERSQLAHLAAHDALTGLPNRTLLLEQVRRALAAAERARARIALLFVDVDHFKTINDRHGHSAGDAYLQAVAQRLNQAVRPGDTAARLGGDEFVVLCEDLRGGEAEALAVAQRISQLLAAPVALADRLVEVGASIGVAVAEPGDEAEVVLSHADEAMYEAKRNGRGRIELFRPRP